MEDLWAFNGEGVAQAIFASRIPIVSAVGHETDVTIADHVADLRAPTPSAAAELIVPDQIEMAVRVGAAAQSLSSGLVQAVHRARSSLDTGRARLQRCRPAPQRVAAETEQSVQTMRSIIHHRLALNSEKVKGREQHLVSLSPTATLARGYALVHSEDGLLVRSADARAGERLRVQMADGSFGARVETDNAPLRGAKPRPVSSEQSRLL